jgi:hypothetical protein
MGTGKGWQEGHIASFADHPDGTVIGRYIANSSRTECALFEPSHVVKGTRALVAQAPADDFFKLVKVLRGQHRLWPALVEGFASGADDIFTSSSPPSSHNLVKLFLVASSYPDLSGEFEHYLQGANRFLAYQTGIDAETDPDILALFHKASETPDIFVNRGKNIRDVTPWEKQPPLSHSQKDHWAEKTNKTWRQLLEELRSGEKPAPDWVRLSLECEASRTAEEQAPTP